MVQKHCSSPFTNRGRREYPFRIMATYRALGTYCPPIFPNLNRERIHPYTTENWAYSIYVEESIKYNTAELMGTDQVKDSNSKPIYFANTLRFLRNVANKK